MIISYELGSSLYLNVTNKCSNRCTFCLRGETKDYQINDSLWQASEDIAASNELWLEREPTVEEIIADLKKRDLTQYKEVVFCGFGEPLIRFDACAEVAKWLKEQGIRTRVNTNGQANLIHKRDVTPEMQGLFDVVSISLNAPNAKEYDEVCKSAFGESAYPALLEFAKKTSSLGIETVMSVVDLLPAEKIEACRKIAEECGARLRVREYIQ